MTPLLEDRGIFSQPTAPPTFRDDLNTDTRASYTLFGTNNATPDWTGSTWTLTGTFKQFEFAAPSAWGNADDSSRVRCRVKFNDTTQLFGAIGFVKPGSLVHSSVLYMLIIGSNLRACYDGSTIFIGDTSIPGFAVSTYYVMEFTRAGNNVTATIYDATGTTVILTQTVTLPAGAVQTAYGAGVALRPMLNGFSNSSGFTPEFDWFEFAP